MEVAQLHLAVLHGMTGSLGRFLLCGFLKAYGARFCFKKSPRLSQARGAFVVWPIRDYLNVFSASSSTVRKRRDGDGWTRN